MIRANKRLPSGNCFRIAVAAIAAILSLAAVDAKACMICVPMPTETLADHLISAKSVVFAREDPNQPFQLAAVDTLKEGGDTIPPVELFLDSVTRRLQSVRPEHREICVWTETGDAPGWRRVGSVENPEEEKVVREILRLAPQWEQNPEARFAYFSDLLGTTNPLLGTLSYLEVGKASYGEIRSLGGKVDRADIRSFLEDVRMLEWHALYILLLAQSDHPDDHQHIREQIDSAAEFSLILNLGAWAAALIEIDGAAGIERLVGHFLQNPDSTGEQTRAIHASLKMHGDEGRTDLRSEIVSAYGVALENHRDLAAMLADDLTRWERFDHAEVVAIILRNAPTDLVEASRLRNHLRLAKSAAHNSSPASEPKENSIGEKLSRFPVAMLLGAGLLLVPFLLAVLSRRRSVPADGRGIQGTRR